MKLDSILMNELQAINIDKDSAEKIKKLDDDTVLISINDEYKEPFTLNVDRLKSNVLTLHFTDIKSKVRIGGRMYYPLDRDQAVELIDFIHINRNKNFIVHCAAGIARSSAVCMYIHLTYGHTLKDYFYMMSEPNTHVLGRLLVEKNREHY